MRNSLQNQPLSLWSELPSSQIADQTPQKTEWLWGYFQTREFPNEWIEKRNKKKRSMDREIRCTLINKDTGKKCNWSATDFVQSKHGVLGLRLDGFLLPILKQPQRTTKL
ncbi:hypothetical protein V1525DRAFT_413621 [Lipomyces kononenkoae]|uniref:Uncharacterized protein n=1 Tax=Lipomyces kononenkoae TaxID=34357 RepID=A0ACC3SSB7_LIPKO